MTKLKRAVEYLRGHPTLEAVYEPTARVAALTVPVNADWAGESSTRRSTSGGVVLAGSCLLASWSRTQASVALSSAEAEFYAIATGITEA